MSQTSESELEKMIQKFMVCNSGQNSAEKSAKRETYVEAKPLHNTVSIIDYNLPLDLSVRNRRVLGNNFETNDRSLQFSNIEESSMPNSENNNPDFIKAGSNIDSLMVNKTESEFFSKRYQQSSNVKMDELLWKKSLAISVDKKMNTEFESNITVHNNEIVPKSTPLSEMSDQFLVSRHIVHNSVQEYELENKPSPVPIREHKTNQLIKSFNMCSVRETRDCKFIGENELTSSNQVCHGEQKQIAGTEILNLDTTESIQPCFADGFADVKGPSCSLNSERTWAIHPKEFSSKNYLKLHYQIHSGERLFNCNICQKKFTQRCSLNRHVLDFHRDQKPHKCENCGKLFGRKDSLDTHIRTHTGEKPFKCYICGKLFTFKNILDKHIRTHTGEKPYKCDICRMSFARKTNLNDHFKRWHKVT